ncbi:collagen-binding domain-containing protein [Sphingomonas changnyeongensis]|uniref:collagen-binding domain-containing protein n=1 Tax=Sphingomonas changnyeongensis TaxID=2698679 RepID=UPI001E4913F4|nr:collagen-binding domain-containing protein [Sphingomonas changnyeongensis]
MAALTVVPAPAMASEVIGRGTTILRELNLFTTGNVVMSQEVEGKSFIGGNLEGGGQFGIGSGEQGFINPATGALPTATIVGNANVSGLQLNGGTIPGGGLVGPRGIDIGGTLTGGLNVNATGSAVRIGALSNANVNGASGGSISWGSRTNSNVNGNGSTTGQDAALGSGFQASLAAKRDALAADLTAFSNELRTFAPTASINMADPNNVRFDVGSQTGTVVFRIADAAAFFSSAASRAFSFNAGAADAIIINVGSATPLDSLIVRQNFLGNGDLYSQRVIWNFDPSIREITFANSFVGSVVALGSRVDNRNFLQGSVAVRSLVMNGEIHLGNFNGTINAIPEPATWAMMIGGFGLVGTAMRRRRAVPLAA